MVQADDARRGQGLERPGETGIVSGAKSVRANQFGQYEQRAAGDLFEAGSDTIGFGEVRRLASE